MEHNDEWERQTIRRYEELADRSRQTGTFTYTAFHSPAGASLAFRAAPERELTLWGGTDGCERVLIRFGNPEELGYEEPWPIRLLAIVPKQPKFADALTHRDFLGAVLNLGIERDQLGDLFVRDNAAYLFVCEGMADFIEDHLERVKHTTVTVKTAEQFPEGIAPSLQEEEFSVASLRLDAILAKAFRLSRTEAKELFDAEEVFSNGRLCRGPESEPADGAVISVRGHGKIVFLGQGRETKKGKIVVRIGRYV